MHSLNRSKFGNIKWQYDNYIKNMQMYANVNWHLYDIAA